MTPDQRATLQRLLGRTPSDLELLTDLLAEALCALSDRLDAYGDAYGRGRDDEADGVPTESGRPR